MREEAHHDLAIREGAPSVVLLDGRRGQERLALEQILRLEQWS